MFFWRMFWVWVATVIGGSLLLAISLVIHSDVTHAEMPYNPNSIPGVTSMSSIAAFLFSMPTVAAMIGVCFWGSKNHWSKRQAMVRLQVLHALGAAITFGIILIQDFDVFSVTCAIVYPLLGALLWGRHLRRHWTA